MATDAIVAIQDMGAAGLTSSSVEMAGKGGLGIELDIDKVPAIDPGKALAALMASPDLCSRRWIWEQYDHLVRGHTVQRPGGDAAVVRIPGLPKGLAITTDCTPRYVYADPEVGGMQAVAESWRNLTAVGAKPLAITDNMNFGNPERPEIMGEFAAAVEGMAEACRALSFPVVSGNVSLYNETNGVAIPPTPAIGGVGLIPGLGAVATLALKPCDEAILLIGEERGHLGQSRYQHLVAGDFAGAPPPVDLAAERKAGDFVRGLIAKGVTRTAHDISDGGLLIALAEMALAGGVGLSYLPNETLPAHAAAFGEDQGRYLIALPREGAHQIMEEAGSRGLPCRMVGECGGDAIRLPGEAPLPLNELRAAHEAWLPAYMG
jgi:phosphoribosylformylglycinamidine synthase